MEGKTFTASSLTICAPGVVASEMLAVPISVRAEMLIVPTYRQLSFVTVEMLAVPAGRQLSSVAAEIRWMDHKKQASGLWLNMNRESDSSSENGTGTDVELNNKSKSFSSIVHLENARVPNLTSVMPMCMTSRHLPFAVLDNHS